MAGRTSSPNPLADDGEFKIKIKKYPQTIHGKSATSTRDLRIIFSSAGDRRISALCDLITTIEGFGESHHQVF